MFSKLKNLKKFTTKSEIDEVIGQPKFQIENRMLYYYGEGIFIAYTSRRFRVEGCERIEYGEEGVYAVSIYHFVDIEMIKIHFGLASFEIDDIESVSDGVIVEKVTYDKTFIELHNLGFNNNSNNFYREGENCKLVDGKLQVKNLFIMYGAYTLFFRGVSKKNKISGFQYTLCE